MPSSIHLRLVAGQLVRPRPTLRRNAQTARLPDEEEDHGHASSSRIPEGRGHPRDRKGKGRAAPEAESYRFPPMVAGRPPDPFTVMGLSRSASTQEVKQQYYRLALILHPDSSHPSASPENFALLHKAYTLLSSPANRMHYERFGQGWASGPERPDMYDRMRAEALFRGRAAAESRRYSARSEAGDGAWGFWGMDGKWYPFPEAGVGKEVDREPMFVSGVNGWAVASVAILFIGWIQYHRWDMVMETRLARLDDVHENASTALAAARREAQMYGHERREQIKRRINESRVLRELETMEPGALPPQLIAPPASGPDSK